MKRRISVAVAGVLVVGIMMSMVGCVGINFNSHGVRGWVKGEGAMVETSFEVADYSEVEISGGVEIIYSSEKSDKIKIEIQENLVEYLRVENKNGVVEIYSAMDFNVLPTNIPKIYISNPDLKGIAVFGAVNMKKGDVIKADSFYFDVSGGSDVEFALDVRQLDATISGAGKMVISGKAETASFDISGSGSVKGFDLETKNTNISVSGAGDVEISCSQALDVEISGAGNVKYKGSPEISQDISGAGRVEKG